MSEFAPFTSECPNCGQERVQPAYASDELIQLLRAGADIEAHCTSCDEYWPISTEERADLERTLARKQRPS
jgi:hypothetical protein